MISKIKRVKLEPRVPIKSFNRPLDSYVIGGYAAQHCQEHEPSVTAAWLWRNYETVPFLQILYPLLSLSDTYVNSGKYDTVWNLFTSGREASLLGSPP